MVWVGYLGETRQMNQTTDIVGFVPFLLYSTFIHGKSIGCTVYCLMKEYFNVIRWNSQRTFSIHLSQ